VAATNELIAGLGPILIFSALKARCRHPSPPPKQAAIAVHKSRQRRTPYHTAGRKLSSDRTVGETLLKFAPIVKEYFSI
jgi:hypothetical protein